MRQLIKQGGQMTNLDPQISISFHIWYMALTFRQVNCSALALSLSQLFSLDLQMSKYGHLRVCVQHIYSPRAQIASKIVENTIPMVWSTFQVQMW